MAILLLSAFVGAGMINTGHLTAAEAATVPGKALTADARVTIAASDPSLAEMNDAHNHSMGSTVGFFDAQNQVPTAKAKALTASTMTAQSIAVPPGIPGLDVSGWQTNVDWSQVWSNGGRFAYVKATESTDYTSSQFAQQYNGSYAAGLIRGAYHFAIPNASSGGAQANFFVNNGGGWTSDGRTLPPLLDIEYNPYTATDGTNTCYGLSASQMVSWIADFANTIRVRTGVSPAIYTTSGWWSACTGNSAAFAKNPLFIARYPSNVADGPGTLPAGWNRYTMWQFADAGIFPGDQDVFNGTYSALQSYASAGHAMSQPVVGGHDFSGDGKPDLLARKPDGTLWLYAGSGRISPDSAFAPGVKIGTGWDMFDQIISAGDVNGDGRSDLLARKPDGTLWLYPGTGDIAGARGVLNSGIQIGTGWNIFTAILTSDANGDGKTDLLGRRADGELDMYAGTGANTPSVSSFRPGVQVGSGWNLYEQVVGVGDLNRDGTDDIVGKRDDGSLWLYRGVRGSWYAGVQIDAPKLDPTDLLISAGDANGDGTPDLLERSADGFLHFMAGSSRTEFPYGTAQAVGVGWQSFGTVIGTGDIDGNHTPDIVAVAGDGTLRFYAGIGSSDGINRSYLPGRTVGYGWLPFSKIIDASDFNGDGARDLIAVRNDGTLWLYPGVGTVSSTGTAYKSGIQIGVGWSAFTQLIAGDFNDDGQVDILATRPDGSMLLYPGTHATSATWFGNPSNVGPGWDAFNLQVSTGDSNGDTIPDVVTRKSKDGSLWLYPGSGNLNAASILSPATQVGIGWQVFKSIMGTGDTNAGRQGDLLGIKADGTLWYYPGTGNAGLANGAYSSAVTVGSGWNVFG
jgi:GH25 family lysozyme M1 (1,4-beta-N-acetylmuramidase)